MVPFRVLWFSFLQEEGRAFFARASFLSLSPFSSGCFGGPPIADDEDTNMACLLCEQDRPPSIARSIHGPPSQHSGSHERPVAAASPSLRSKTRPVLAMAFQRLPTDSSNADLCVHLWPMRQTPHHVESPCSDFVCAFFLCFRLLLLFPQKSQSPAPSTGARSPNSVVEMAAPAARPSPTPQPPPRHPNPFGLFFYMAQSASGG